MSERKPLVSIVTATYNRPEMLRYAIRSVLDQTLTDWELLVIGDCCTDNTEEVVASFNDDRIFFYNMPENFGEQSGPNNEGIRRSRGEYIAFLNHDDMYLADHLERLVSYIESSGADMVYSIGLAHDPPDLYQLLGPTKDGTFQPHAPISASAWLCRRSLFAEIGPWRSFRETYNAPSQDWLFRCWKAKKAMLAHDDFSVVLPRSGGRQNSYIQSNTEEQSALYEQVKSPSAFRSKIYKQLAIEASRQRNSLPVLGPIKTVLRSIAIRFARLFGVAPFAMKNFFRFGRKKGYINSLRRKRGLERK